ncbi:MAG: hypothetical protein HQL19_00975 [Candidatus Omnitrophica bacterium]|nr:hypothetical protein [Candidatus Omnitrophota bacterium]
MIIKSSFCKCRRVLFLVISLTVFLFSGEARSACSNQPSPGLTTSRTQYVWPSNVTLNLTAVAANGWATQNSGIYVGASKQYITNSSDYITKAYVYTWTSPLPGTYAVKGYADFANSCTTFSGTLTITVAAPTPTIGLTASVSNANIQPVNIAMTATPSISGYGSVQKVEFYNGGTLLGTVSSSPFSYTWSNASAGAYSLTAKLYATAGTVTSAAISGTIYAKPSFITFDSSCKL